ncbi:MAG: GAF domain-containing sensor histidine kinase [Chloroflexi bacterium]|nr:GAF domain-containing sensor histidine kinase [Chloroflexota bacterium]
MNTRTLRWITVIAPTAFVVAFELVTRSLYGDILPAWGHTAVILGAVSAGAFLFSTFVFATMARLEREIRVRNQRLALLNAVASEASASLEVDEVGAAITRNVMHALGADAVGLALTSEADGELRLIAQSGLPLHLAQADGSLGPYDCECRQALALGQPLVVEDSLETASCGGILGGRAHRTCISAPIRSKGNNIGAIFVARRISRPFAEDEVDLVTALGSQVGAVLQNAQLFSKTGAIAVLQERQRVSREVHDGLAQTLGYLNMQMGIIDHLMSSGEPAKAQSELEAMAQVTREAYHDLRQSIMDLRTPLSGGLRRSLREYLERFSLQTGIPCHFEGHHGLPAALSPAAEVQLTRIVQEALTNVKKHAAGAQVWLSVEADDQRVTVVIRDDGPGFDPAKVPSSGRFGLQTMKERAESAGGSLTIHSRPGAGTRLEVTVPVEGLKAA